MKKHAMISKALLVMMLFLLVSSAVNANAQTTTDDDDDELDDETETEDEDDDDSDDDSNERELQVQVTDDHVEIESKLESGENENSFKIDVSTGEGGIKFQLSYEVENATSETETEFEVEFEELVEYLDSNDNGVYDDEVDDDVQTMELMSFQPIAYNVLNETDGVVHIFDISTTDGVFTAVAYLTTNFVEVNGTIIAPSQMKIDIIIDGFNYTDENSQLALKVKLEASTETSLDEDTEDEDDGRATDESEVDIMMDGFNGFFSWVETAEIDGVVYPVNSSIDEVSVNEKKIYLNYERGDLIIHDPKVGFENILVNPSAPMLFGDLLTSSYLPIVAVAAIVLIGAVIVVKRRS